jgi:single-strand DNA-binding protein
MSLAKAMLVGIIVSDVEKRFTPNNNTAVTSFQLSVQAPGRMGPPDPSVTFTVQVSCWRQLAEVASEQLAKGDAVMVEGKLMLQSYQTPDGVAKKSYEVEAASVSKLSGLPIPLYIPPAGNGSGAPQSGGGMQPQSYPQAQQPQYAQSQQAYPQQQPQQYGYAQPQKQAPVAAAQYGQPMPPQQQVPPNPLMASMSSEEFMMTEDDIPF